MRLRRPRRPLVLFDRDCGFCRRWVRRWEQRTGARVRYAPMQSLRLRLWYRVPRGDARRAMQLIETTGKRYSGAEAVFRALGHAPRLRLAMRLARLPGVLQGAQLAYRVISSHRVAASRVDRLLFGRDTRPPSTRVVRWAFLRGLGAVYFAAFSSLRVQVLGLYGERGIEPVHDVLSRARGLPLRDRVRASPTLLWLDDSDRALLQLTRAGQLAAIALMANVAPRASAAALWVLYLSFNTVGGDFLPFQWDVLLLETGLQSVLVAPGGLRPGLGRHEPSWPARQLLRSLAARLYLQSGMVKLQSGDPAWRTLSACKYHFETQPLPTRFGWYQHHLPRPLQQLSTAAVLGLELGLPVLMFGPRRVRRVAFAGFIGLQGLIAASGNYGFFNLLTAALGLWTLDDTSMPRRLAPSRPERSEPAPLWRGLAQLATAPPLAALSVLHLVERLRFAARLPRLLRRLDQAATPLMSTSSYGLFAVMTTRRPELVIEGSMDGREWREYEFRYKPGPTTAPPRFVAPHQPRLDWQMWFAALSSRPPTWLSMLVVRLLQGSPDVMGLFKRVPFDGETPRFVRVMRYDYRMADLATHRATGAWWKREPRGLYFPAMALGGARRERAPASPDRPDA